MAIKKVCFTYQFENMSVFFILESQQPKKHQQDFHNTSDEFVEWFAYLHSCSTQAPFESHTWEKMVLFTHHSRRQFLSSPPASPELINAGGNGTPPQKFSPLCTSESACINWHVRALDEGKCAHTLYGKAGKLRRRRSQLTQGLNTCVLICAGTKRANALKEKEAGGRAMMGSLSRKRDVSLRRVDSAPPTSLLRWPFALLPCGSFFGVWE